VIWSGMVVFGLSRPVQFIWIVASLVSAWEHVVLWQAVVQLGFTMVFTSLQLYSLTIHYSLYLKLSEEKLNVPEDNAMTNSSESVGSSLNDDDDDSVTTV
jgi:hypothetical protein